MLKLIESVEFQEVNDAGRTDTARVCLLIPPLWDLRNYVAVNPFLGFASKPFDATARIVADGLDAQLLPGIAYYRACWERGDFGSAELTSAAIRAGCDPATLDAILTGRSPVPLRKSNTIHSFAERHDRLHGTEWNDVVLRSAARWCAVYASDGGRFGGAGNGRGLFTSWLESAAIDRSLDIAGLRGFRSWTAGLPAQPDDAIQEMLQRLGVPVPERDAYLYRLLGGLYGWASYFRRLAWEKDPQDPGLVTDLLAIRICFDAAVAELAPRTTPTFVAPVEKTVEDESVNIVFQDALEDGFTRRLLGEFHTARLQINATRPKVQAVFCIDVRSEPLRRHLEAESPDIETRGFAGFFGVTLNWRSEEGDSARCPVLLKPGVLVELSCTSEVGSIRAAATHLQSAPAAAFSFVEILGVAYGLRLTSARLVEGISQVQSEASDAFSLTPDSRGGGIISTGRLELAAGILKNMGFANSFARLVMICGHEGHSANNSHAAGLDCGACGGHGGAINARIAAAVLNDPDVRSSLPSVGWNIPGDTHFVPAVHDTSTDGVQLLDTDQVPSEHQDELTQLRTWLESAGQCVQKERATALGLGGRPAGILDRLLRRRSRDGSEVRSEWALARNAAFIAARRCRTRGVNLEGRAFLHEYEASLDLDDSVLTLILSAPMVVASWINLQYFASTVDNAVFGSGDKAIQNRVGTHGVVLGNGGDLRTGLALQSVHSAEGQWFHEPLRLQVIVEADPVQIDRVLNAQPGVKELVENGWVRLFALHPSGYKTQRYEPGRGWKEL